MHSKLRSVVGLTLFALCAPACADKTDAPAPASLDETVKPAALATPSAAELRAKASALFGKLPAVAEQKDRPITDAKVNLGRILYHDPRFSKSQLFSCNSCHALDGFGVDVRPDAVAKGTSFGHNQKFGDRNSPTVFNAAIHIAQFWDGRAADVEEQAKGPILNPVEMGMADDVSVVAVLKSIPAYEAMFKTAFPESAQPINYDNMASAIGSFERKLLTTDDFDKFLGGQDDKLSEVQRQGLEIFISSGCIACHAGPGFGGAMFQKLGLLKPYPTADEGRFRFTGKEADKYFFKVPSLRNAAKTAPYFHDGSVKTLTEAVTIMSEIQTPGGRLPADKVASIVAFLDTLTGTPDPTLLTTPTLPDSGPKTPKAVLD